MLFSAIPNQNATELKAKFDPVAAHLAKELGVQVEFFPSADKARAWRHSGTARFSWRGSAE